MNEGYSERSQQLAAELKAKAIANLNLVDAHEPPKEARILSDMGSLNNAALARIRDWAQRIIEERIADGIPE